MKASFRNVLASAALGACFVLAPLATCSAEVVEGQAPIIDGDVTQARFAARQDAMRSYIENKVGVKVESSTEVDMGMVVADHILTKADGYVSVKRVVKEQQSGDIYIVQLDLDASSQMIATAVQDVQSRLQALDENSSRYGVSVAVSERGIDGRPDSSTRANDYVRGLMEDKGFLAVTNDAVLQYMGLHANLEDPAVGAEIRRIARTNREQENALLRGAITTVSVTPAGGYQEALVEASFELIGLDNNVSNSYSNYVKAVAPTAAEAVRKARDEAARQAVDSLGQKALQTEQRENRGGVHHTKVTLVFSNLGDAASRSQQILAALKAVNCRVIRYGLTSAGTFQAFVDATGYATTADIQMAVTQSLGCQPLMDEGAGVGSSKLQFQF